MRTLFLKGMDLPLSICHRTFAIALFLSICLSATAQNIGVNGTGAAADASAILDVSATDKGLLIPRVALTSTADIATIPTPATSLLVYNTANISNVSPGFYYWNGTVWIRIGLVGDDWHLSGNTGTNPANNFIGTTDGQDLAFRTNNTERARLMNGGRFGIGLPNPADQLHVANGNIRLGEVNPTNSGAFPDFGRRLIFSGGPAGTVYNSDNSDGLWMARHNQASDQSEIRMNLGDNCGSSVDAFVIQTGGAGCPANTVYFRFDVAGNAYKPGGGAWTALSDRRLKENINDYNHGLSTLKRIRPVTYRYNGKGGTAPDGQEYVGVIAQEIQEILPEAVRPYGEYLSVDPTAFTYVLINSVQEQQEQIEGLEREKEEMENEMEEMKKRMEKLEMKMEAVMNGGMVK